MKATAPVTVRRESLLIPTYLPAAPEKHPMFLDKRVYQGSSGKVYPLPFIESIATDATEREWESIELENEFLSVTLLPELGGRIHACRDKTNGYDLVYRQNVIKPALVGLAGPWISGGIEFNWPQHHRPSTFMPTDVQIDTAEDGSITVWLSEHEPMNRMKGMHGICLHPGKALVEIKARVYNRTESVQTFLWWVNIATKVHSNYQAFFPGDVCHVADHAKRSTSAFPFCESHYYGIDYGQRAAKKAEPDADLIFQPLPHYAPNDLRWYANIPVPTSYMCTNTVDAFFGGYDHDREAGLVHVANPHISPGKKLWTWGNHPFGYAWDRQLTDPDENGLHAPYIELMAGVFTDNQPDFSFLAPGETKSWSQFLFPIQRIGVPQQANEKAAISLEPQNGNLKLGVATTESFEKVSITVVHEGTGDCLFEWTGPISPAAPFITHMDQSPNLAHSLQVCVATRDCELIRLFPRQTPVKEVPPPAMEPPAPELIANQDDLYLTGLHLYQYRHATRKPEDYWREALQRDMGDARCNQAMGTWYYERGEFESARVHFERAIERLTQWNPNPVDGESFYSLGLTLRHLGNDDAACSAFYKAVWNHAWQAASSFALAELDCKHGRYERALEHLECVIRLNGDHLKAYCLRAMILRKCGCLEEADSCLEVALKRDPLDPWARSLKHKEAKYDPQTALDLALDLARAGFYAEAVYQLQSQSEPDPSDPRALGTKPLVHYYVGWLQLQLGQIQEAQEAFSLGALAHPDHCFPARIEEIAILKSVIQHQPEDALAPCYLGNLLYHRNRQEEAIACWEQSVKLNPNHALAWRNLGIATFNVRAHADDARKAYDRALSADPGDARVLYERDQLWKCMGVRPQIRLKELESRRSMVEQRDDLVIELCSLYTQTGHPERALEMLLNQRFQPWEGGEGQVLTQFELCHLTLGRKALHMQAPTEALSHFEAALQPPENLGETSHPLANRSDIHYWIGQAHHACGDAASARKFWTLAAEFRGDFQDMSVRLFSEKTYFSALSMRRLGQNERAIKLFEDLLEYGETLLDTPAVIDYFATSLPTMLVFHDDLQFRQNGVAMMLQALAHSGLGNATLARSLIDEVLSLDPNHALAHQFSTELSLSNPDPDEIP